MRRQDILKSLPLIDHQLGSGSYHIEISDEETEYKPHLTVKANAEKTELYTEETTAISAGVTDQFGDKIDLRQLILDCEIVCPISGTRNWTEVRQFNLMFSTDMGSTADGATKIYLRPETAQGIFVNFLNVQKTGRMKIDRILPQCKHPFFSIVRSTASRLRTLRVHRSYS